MYILIIMRQVNDMKIEKLGAGKIKVTVSHLELDTWDINPRAISPDSPQLKEFIGSMIAHTANETGIVLSGSNVLVEARPQGEDFVFIITTMGQDTDKMHREILKSVKRQKLISGEYKVCAKTESQSSYFFFDSLMHFAEMLSCTGCELFNGTALYRSEAGYVHMIEKTHPSYEKCILVLSEYAKKLSDTSGDVYACERLKPYADSCDFEKIMKCYI